MVTPYKLIIISLSIRPSRPKKDIYWKVRNDKAIQIRNNFLINTSDKTKKKDFRYEVGNSNSI